MTSQKIKIEVKNQLFGFEILEIFIELMIKIKCKSPLSYRVQPFLLFVLCPLLFYSSIFLFCLKFALQLSLLYLFFLPNKALMLYGRNLSLDLHLYQTLEQRILKQNHIPYLLL